MQEKVSIKCSWCGWENPSLGLRALHPRGGFSHPHQEYMKDTYNLKQDQISVHTEPCIQLIKTKNRS